MQINNTLESLSILTDSDEIFKTLSQMIDKNFSKTLSSKGKMISFYQESEMPQRKYFFKFIKRLYERENNESIEIKFAEYKTIKLNYIQQNAMTKVIKADIEFSKNEAIFTISKQDKLFFSYIIKSFDGCEYKLNQNQNKLHIKIKNNSQIQMLEKFILAKQHLKFMIDFCYKKDEFENFKKNYNSSFEKFSARLSALNSLFEDKFRLLGCSIESSFETVRESYLCLVKAYHPDRHMAKSQNVKDAYRLKFEQIQNAYETLKPLFKEQERYAAGF
ncbi:adenylosuccinate lyase [Campylobacter mucosalis]|uniref:adenylosuccinate lyase n=1 Tax=Campylobacter mucosalis TaxID=202 RepID=UPI0014700EE1|nr:adenylosuccinate lyase [Campylobacter mucosalis]